VRLASAFRFGCHYLHLRDKAEPVKARPVLGGWLAVINMEYPSRHLGAGAHTAQSG
jgi:hypothetical protein